MEHAMANQSTKRLNDMHLDGWMNGCQEEEGEGERISLNVLNMLIEF